MRRTLLSAAAAIAALLAFASPAAAVTGGGAPGSPWGVSVTKTCVDAWNAQASGPPLDAATVTVRDFLGVYPPAKLDFAPSPPAPTAQTTFYWYQTILSPTGDRAFVCRVPSTSGKTPGTTADWMKQLSSPPATTGCAAAMAKCAAYWNTVGGVFLEQPLATTTDCFWDDATNEWKLSFAGQLDGAAPAPTPIFNCKLNGALAADPSTGSVVPYSVSCDRYGKH